MVVWCTDVMHLSEAEAYLRITAARAARQHPILLEMLHDGRLHLSGIALLAPHLTEANRERILTRAVHKSKRQIKELIAELAPRPDVPTVVRKLPERRPTTLPSSLTLPTSKSLLCPDRVVESAQVSVCQPAKVVEPLGPSRYKVQFTASAELREKLERLRNLTGAADLSAVIDRAVTEKLERLEARRYGKTDRPRKSLEETDTSPSSRYIPTPITASCPSPRGTPAAQTGVLCQVHFSHPAFA